MFKCITVLQLLFVVHIYMEEVTNKRTINVGTVLFDFRDSEKDCWTYESVLLLMSRSLMQRILPENYASEYEKSNVDRIIPYLYSTLNTVRSLSKGSTQQTMVLALSDVIGGYMRSQLLATIKTEYYQGNIDFGKTEQLFSLYAHLKSLLRTNGDGWKIPHKVHIKLNDLPSLRISVKTSGDACEHFDVGHPSEEPSVITIPVPHFDNDIDPQSIEMPFRRQNVCSMQDASSAFIVQKYYVDGMQCLLGTTSEEGVMRFNAEMDAWLNMSVMPLLELEELYPAFGGVYQVFATVQRVRALKRSSSLDERAPLLMARNGDGNIPLLSGHYPQSTDSAVALMKRLPIQQHPAFVASIRQEEIPENPTNDLKYSDIKYSKHFEETSSRVPVKLSSGFENSKIVTKSDVFHENEHLLESMSDKQSNLGFDILPSGTMNDRVSLDIPKEQISPILPAKTEPLSLSLQLNTFSLQPPQSRSSFIPFHLHENATHGLKDTGILYPFNGVSNYLAHEKTHISKNIPSFRSFSPTWTVGRSDSHVTTSDISVNVLMNFHENVDPYIRNYSASMTLSRSPSVMSSTLPDTSRKIYAFTKSKDAYINILPISSNALESENMQYNNENSTRSQVPSMSSLSDVSNINKTASLFESPLISNKVSSTFGIKGSTYVSEPSALSLFFDASTSFLPYSPLPTSSHTDITTSESSEVSSAVLFSPSSTSLTQDSTLPLSVTETVSTSSPISSQLTYIATSEEFASEEVAYEKSNNSIMTFETPEQSPVSDKINSTIFPVSQPSYDDKDSKIMRTSNLKNHNIQSKIHEKPRFRFLKPFLFSDSPFAKLSIVSPLYKLKESSGSRKSVKYFIRSNVKSTTIDHSLMIGIPKMLLGSPHLPNSPHSQHTVVNGVTTKNALITNNVYLRNGRNSHWNSISSNNNNETALKDNALNLLSKSKLINSSIIDTTVGTALITKIQPTSRNANLEALPKMFEKENNRFKSLAWKRSASKDLFTFPTHSHSEQTITLETYVVPYGSVVSAFESGKKFLFSSIPPPVTNVMNSDGRKPVPNFLSMDLNYIDKNPEYVSANNLNIPGISPDEVKTEPEVKNRAYSQDAGNTDDPVITLILKKANHSQEHTQTKDNSKGSSLLTKNVLLNGNAVGEFPRYFTKGYNINITLMSPKAIDCSEIILNGISPVDETSRNDVTSVIGGNKRKSNKLYTTRDNVTKDTNSPGEEFLQMELEDNEVNKEIHEGTESEEIFQSRSRNDSKENNNLDNMKMKYKNSLIQTQKQHLQTQEIAEHVKGNREESGAKLSSNNIILNDKIHPSKETNYQKIKKKLFKSRPIKDKFQEYRTQPGDECRREYAAQDDVGIVNKNEYVEDEYDYDDEEEWNEEGSPLVNDAADGQRKSKVSHSYTVKSIYEEDPRRTAPKFPFFDTLMENGLKHAVGSLIVSPDLGILNVILMVILWSILVLCCCIKDQSSKAQQHVRISPSEPQIQSVNYPFRKLMSSLSSFYRVVSFRTGPRGNVNRESPSKVRKEQSSKGFNSNLGCCTTWTCECSSSVDATCSAKVRLAEEGSSFNSIRSEISGNSDLLRKVDEALDIIRAANTILSKPHSCPHLFPKQQTLSPPQSRSVPTFPSWQSPSEQSRSSSPYQSWLYREAFWPYPPASSASRHSEELERELPSQERSYSSKVKFTTDPLQSHSDWPSQKFKRELSSQKRHSPGATAPLQSDSDRPPQELERERPSQKRHSSGVKATTQPLQFASAWSSQEFERELPSQKRYSSGPSATSEPLQSDSDWPSLELDRNMPSELETQVGTVCSQFDSDLSSCISMDTRLENVEESLKSPRKGSARRKKCKECGLYISSPSSQTDDTSRDAG